MPRLCALGPFSLVDRLWHRPNQRPQAVIEFRFAKRFSEYRRIAGRLGNVSVPSRNGALTRTGSSSSSKFLRVDAGVRVILAGVPDQRAFRCCERHPPRMNSARSREAPSQRCALEAAEMPAVWGWAEASTMAFASNFAMQP